MSFSADPAQLPEEVDLLIVANLDIPPDRVAGLAREARARSLLLVTTHGLFPEEEAELRRLVAPARLWWLPMSWLLDDAEMEACDDDAIAGLAPRGERINGGDFMQASRRLRNARAAERLATYVRYKRSYAASGLGAIAEAWPGARTIDPPASHIARRGGVKARLARARELATVEIVEGRGERYAFLGATRRLRFQPDVDTTTVHVPLASALIGGRGRALSTRLLTGAVAVASKGRSIAVATTVHNFKPSMLTAFPDLRVFVDGLHPPNYPVAYGVAYRGSRIVPREECDALWFAKCGCEVLPRAQILADELPYRDPSAPRAIRNIALMLNHAGDWTALIDRSDTDLVTLEFVRAAALAPELRFRVRAHPTMATPDHDGISSLARIRGWVRAQGLANLEFSEASFEEDMAWTDCCVSEYSNVLIDCMKAGKACVALNPTNRRNLLDHLSVSGLREVHDAGELIAFLREVRVADEPGAVAG